MPPSTARALALPAAVFAVAGFVVLGYSEHAAPARCASGFVALGARCCAEGQRLEDGACSGEPRACPPGFTRAGAGRTGCVVRSFKVEIDGGSATVGPIDWEAPGRAALRRVRVGAFRLDNAEVTYERWASCSKAGRCRRLPAREPGLPVTGVGARDAEAFCKFAGGRLPSSAEWLFAAAGPEARRFAWGATGLVCRRAAYGLVQGPCARGARGPELAGSRPDGSTPEAIVDLAGNVAEWTREPDGSLRARGGSYRSRLAAELKTWSFERTDRAAPHIGFRCAYAAPAPRR